MRGVYERQQTVYRRIKIETINQITERSYTVTDVADRLEITTHSLYAWLKSCGEQSLQQFNRTDIKQLKVELRRDTEEGLQNNHLRVLVHH